MSATMPVLHPLPQLAVDYVATATPAELLQDKHVLAVLGFGNDAPHLDDPRYLRVPLQLHGDACFEIWRCSTPVAHGRDGEIAWASDGQLMFGVIEVEERADADDHASGLRDATEHAYLRLTRFVGDSGTPHLL
ncbi:MAG: pteridine-dependent deoxygenase, partial [Pseudomonadota bacterium]|nr:pteridine-dependent deoxygenase [Pseudomonadota bacterium]